MAVYLAAVCQVQDVEDCPLPAAGSKAASLLEEARARSAFGVLYPCELPASQVLTAADVRGERGRQTVTLFFEGPFEISIRQSQVAPILSPDPTGSSRVVIDLLPGVRADLIERYDGSRRAEYRLVWTRGGVYYEVLASGPPLSRRQIVNVAKTLQ